MLFKKTLKDKFCWKHWTADCKTEYNVGNSLVVFNAYWGKISDVYKKASIIVCYGIGQMCDDRQCHGIGKKVQGAKK